MNLFAKSYVAGILLFFPAILLAQSLQLTSDNKGRLGYKDAAGKIVIKCDYDYAEPFDQKSVAKVGKGDKYGLIKPDGQFALPMQYSEITDIKGSDISLVKKDKNYGLVNSQTGAIVLPVVYTYISKFNCYGLAWLEKDGKIKTTDGKQYAVEGTMGIVDKEGKLIVTPKYKGLFEFSRKTEWNKDNVYGDAEILEVFSQMLSDTLKTDCKFIGVSNDAASTKQAGLMDDSGKEIFMPGTFTWIAKPSSGIMRYWNDKTTKVVYGYYVVKSKTPKEMNSVNTKFDDIKYVTHGDFDGDIAPVNSSTEWYFVNRSFSIVKSGFRSVKYVKGIDDMHDYWAGIAPGKSAVYRTDGKQFLAGIAFDDVNAPNDKSGDDMNFAIKKAGKWGLFTSEGTQLLAPKYDYLTSSVFGNYVNKIGNKCGVINVKGKTIIPAEYADLICPEKTDVENIWVQSPNDSLYYNFSVVAGRTLSSGYYRVCPFVDGMALVLPLKEGTTRTPKYDNEYIMVNTSDEVVVDKPFPMECSAAVREYVIKNGGKPLTQNQSNQLVLKLTRGSVRYELSEILPETAWDY